MKKGHRSDPLQCYKNAKQLKQAASIGEYHQTDEC